LVQPAGVRLGVPDRFPAITIRRPWIDCIAHGFKQVENRGRHVRYRGRLALHAARVADAAADRDLRVAAMWGSRVRIGQPVGAVVKVATLVDCHQVQPDVGTCCLPCGDRYYSTSRRQVLAWHLVLDNIVHLPEPVYCRGQQGVPWMLPPDVATRVATQLGETQQREEEG
jgi:hypothetical protein